MAVEDAQLRSDTTRRLLLVAAALFLLPSDAPARTTTFVEALSRFGVEPATARQSLARAGSGGFLSSQRVGRHTHWRLTVEATRRLGGAKNRAFVFKGCTDDWDRRWLLLLASVPERDRAARHLLRSRLAWSGLGSPAPGVWVGTHTSRQTEVERILRLAGMTDRAQLFVGEHIGATPLETMVGQAWDIEALAADYDRFFTEFSSPRAPDPLVRLIELYSEWTRLVALDPELPRELLPKKWQGTSAASLFLKQHARWEPAAVTEWDRINAQGTKGGAARWAVETDPAAS